MWGAKSGLGLPLPRPQSPATHVQNKKPSTQNGAVIYKSKGQRGAYILPVPDSLGRKLPQFECEGERKSKENVTEEGREGGPTVSGLVTWMKKVCPPWTVRGSGSLAQSLLPVSEVHWQSPLGEAEVFCS